MHRLVDSLSKLIEVADSRPRGARWAVALLLTTVLVSCTVRLWLAS